jgi:drug/metabolite transporter (DMT)-like permease
VGGAIAYATTVTLFVAANKLTTSAHAIFLQSSAPLFLVILGPVLLRERLHARDVAFLMAMACGMWLAFSGSPPVSRTAPHPPAGNLLALVSSLTWALTLIALRYLERTPAQRGDGLSVVIVGNLLASLVALPFLTPWPAATMASWIAVAYLGMAQIALAYVCLTAAMRHLPALDVSLLLLLEPVLNPVWTWLFHGEQPGYAVILGGAVILASTAVRVVLEARRVGQPAG